MMGGGRGSTPVFTDALSSAAEVPSAPDIEKVHPFSSTAVVEFEEPASVGGVPVLRYKLEWRIPGQDWTSGEYSVKDGEWITPLNVELHLRSHLLWWSA